MIPFPKTYRMYRMYRKYAALWPTNRRLCISLCHAPNIPTLCMSGETFAGYEKKISVPFEAQHIFGYPEHAFRLKIYFSSGQRWRKWMLPFVACFLMSTTVRFHYSVSLFIHIRWLGHTGGIRMKSSRVCCYRWRVRMEWSWLVLRVRASPRLIANQHHIHQPDFHHCRLPLGCWEGIGWQCGVPLNLVP